MPSEPDADEDGAPATSEAESSGGTGGVDDTEKAGDLTDGDLIRPMFGLAWPLVVIQLLQVAY